LHLSQAATAPLKPRGYLQHQFQPPRGALSLPLASLFSKPPLPLPLPWNPILSGPPHLSPLQVLVKFGGYAQGSDLRAIARDTLMAILGIASL
jgi:hypothetical protein